MASTAGKHREGPIIQGVTSSIVLPSHPLAPPATLARPVAGAMPGPGPGLLRTARGEVVDRGAGGGQAGANAAGSLAPRRVPLVDALPALVVPVETRARGAVCRRQMQREKGGGRGEQQGRLWIWQRPASMAAGAQHRRPCTGPNVAPAGVAVRLQGKRSGQREATWREIGRRRRGPPHPPPALPPARPIGIGRTRGCNARSPGCAAVSASSKKAAASSIGVDGGRPRAGALPCAHFI
jgi:hypothetical protein